MVKKIIIIIGVLVLAFIIFSYARVEILTFRHKTEFESLYKSTNMIDGNIDYLKVMNYSKDSAIVYYVGDDKSYGIKIEFTKENNDWVLKEWNTNFHFQRTLSLL